MAGATFSASAPSRQPRPLDNFIAHVVAAVESANAAGDFAVGEWIASGARDIRGSDSGVRVRSGELGKARNFYILTVARPSNQGAGTDRSCPDSTCWGTFPFEPLTEA